MLWFECNLLYDVDCVGNVFFFYHTWINWKMKKKNCI